MPRFALEIEYDGSPFAGWQRQSDQETVQGAIERAIRVLQPDFEAVFGAGRTDAGVHARGQVAHVDLERDWPPFELVQAVNQHLKPSPIVVLRGVRVPDDFHARFSATERRYLYRVLARRARPALDEGRVWHIRHTVDVESMQSAANHLIGKHDFTTFRSTMCQARSPVKNLDAIEIRRDDFEVSFQLKARSFLHNQVRSIVGSLLRVGSGAWEPDKLKQVLEARDRAACGPVAPAHGLYLMAVDYADDPFAGSIVID